MYSRYAWIWAVCGLHWIALVSCQTETKRITLNLRSCHNGDLFSTDLTVGQDPAGEKTFRMLISTSLSITWISSTRLTKSGYESAPNGDFEPQDHAIRLTGAGYADTFFKVFYDRWRVGERLIDRQPFAVVHSIGRNWAMERGVEGMLGLGDGASNPVDVDYLFKNLYKSNHIDHLIYSLYINNTAIAANRMETQLNGEAPQSSEGAVVLGGVDSKYYTGDLRYVRMHEYPGRAADSNMSLFISNIKLDWSRVDRNELKDTISQLGSLDMQIEPTRLMLDSSLILYVGPRKTLDTIHIGILGATPMLRKAFYAFKDCRMDNKPDLVFTLKDGFDVTITPEEYVIEHQLEGNKLCLSAFTSFDELSWSFGTRFMRKYYTVFDHEMHQVGFAKPT